MGCHRKAQDSYYYIFKTANKCEEREELGNLENNIQENTSYEEYEEKRDI